MCRTSARDFVEALLARCAPRAISPGASARARRYLVASGPASRRSGSDLESDTGHARCWTGCMHRRGWRIWKRLRRRIRSDRIEPEPLFWAAWHALPPREQYAIAREAWVGSSERVHDAAVDGSPAGTRSPIRWSGHRHRIHPLLLDKRWRRSGTDPNDRFSRSAASGSRYRQRHYRGRRPIWSQLKDSRAPWHARQDE
jgi:hypothetical protein